MSVNLKNSIKNNKNSIFVSIFSSLITVIVVFAIIFGLNWFGAINIALGDQGGNVLGLSKPVATGTAAEQSQLISTINKANPAVVSIIISKKTQPNNQTSDPFYYLFGVPNSNQNNSTQEQEVGGGSGFLVSSNGYVVTNNHVVSDNTASYTVQTHDGKKHNVKIIATDKTFDVAVLKIEGSNFPYLTFADSKGIKVGQTVIAIGNALSEFQNTVSSGIVSGLYRSITASDGTGSTEQLSEVIQTDAAINPGNSGGPLLDIKGHVIGMNTAIESDAQNIGFAIPSNVVSTAVASVIKNGEIVKPYLGIRYVQIDSDVAKSNNLPIDYGVLVSGNESSNEPAVVSGSPADKAGIVSGDIITKIDGETIDQNKSFAAIIQQKKVGQTVTLEILHNGDKKTVKVTLEKAPKNT